MAKIVLISCASKKLAYSARAKDLYISTLFKLNLRYARKLKPQNIFILSAKYGLLGLDTVIAPYDKSLNKMSTLEVSGWAEKVIIQLSQYADTAADNIVFLAGEKYRKYLIQYINHYSVPMQGLGIGKQLRYLKERVDNE